MRLQRAFQLPLLLRPLSGSAIAVGASEQGPNQLPLGVVGDHQKPPPSNLKSPDTLPAFLNALDVLQDQYFATWQGIWPDSIDWTSAVIGTYLSASLTTLSTSFSSLSSKSSENLVNKYFSQLVASYFGQNAFALRQQAYDDMLWVVLGWLDSIKFINTHSKLHYSSETWYGTQWIPPFAHRARIFWELASQGWDTSLCDGGMVWSPYLEPYKNAITNELFITASISMYLYFPGDSNTSPFSFPSMPGTETISGSPGIPRDPKYLVAGIEAYKWLKGSNMTDAKGLYVDGYHISNRRSGSNDTKGNTKCDARNEMVYTYNQGVLLSGQRGLYEATGAISYLQDGHELIKDVITATGWDLKSDSVLDDGESENKIGKWRGLGRRGVLEEVCDAAAYCSQNGQTFKGIFFHHLTTFCADLPEHLHSDDVPVSLNIQEQSAGASEDARKIHENECAKYGAWIKHNAKSALTTVNEEGKFGMWWGAPRGPPPDGEIKVELPDQAVDYRNQGVPKEWEDSHKKSKAYGKGDRKGASDAKDIGRRDLNDRGRGRTVETQGGGIAVLRALWELVDTR